MVMCELIKCCVGGCRAVCVYTVMVQGLGVCRELEGQNCESGVFVEYEDFRCLGGSCVLPLYV